MFRRDWRIHLIQHGGTSVLLHLKRPVPDLTKLRPLMLDPFSVFAQSEILASPDRPFDAMVCAMVPISSAEAPRLRAAVSSNTGCRWEWDMFSSEPMPNQSVALAVSLYSEFCSVAEVSAFEFRSKPVVAKCLSVFARRSSLLPSGLFQQQVPLVRTPFSLYHFGIPIMSLTLHTLRMRPWCSP